MDVGALLRRAVGQGPKHKHWRGTRAHGPRKISVRFWAFFRRPAKIPPHSTVVFRSVVFRLPPRFDEHGFPAAWKIDPLEDPFSRRLLRKSRKHWPIFEVWCDTRSFKAIPASMETVIRFLTNPPVEGRELYDTWRAISKRHRAYYRKAVVDPCFMLRLEGVEVCPDWSVIVPDEVKREFGL